MSWIEGPGGTDLVVVLIGEAVVKVLRHSFLVFYVYCPERL